MFNDKQTQVLAYELDSSRIKSRSKGNISLSYLEGFDIIETANKIFGHGNWGYSISSLQSVSQEQNQNQNNVICYKAVINVVVHDLQHSKHVSREDVGFGTGIAKTLADPHEGGAKEAVTDAIKRTLRSFGNQFGNSLYDKSRQHQNQQQTYQQPVQLQQQSQQQKHYQQPQTQQVESNQGAYSLQEYTSILNLGLQILEQGENIVIIGDKNTIFNSKDIIKACSFRWSNENRQWYKQKYQQQAA